MHILQSTLYGVLYLCGLFLSICCEEATLDDVTSITPELKNIHSFFYKSTEEDLSSAFVDAKKDEKSSAMASPCNCKDMEEQNTQDAIFYKRLITLLLSNLAMQKVDNGLVGTLSISMSSAQFEYLQNFVNGQGSIREVDRILDDMIKQSEYSTCYYMAEMFHYFDLFVSKISDHWVHYLSLMKEHRDIIIVSFIVIASFMILRRQRWSRSLLIFLIIDIIFVMSFFMTWWRLIQEEEIKLMAAQAQFREMPIACQPHKMNFWDKMVTWISPTNCEKYYETIMTNPRLKVTPALALTHFLSTVIFQPLSYFGLAISEFIDNATGNLNFFYRFPVIIIIFISICICIILIPFSWIGGSINFGIGPFFKFAIKGRESSKGQERIDRIYENILLKQQLKESEEMKQITLEQDNDPAGGDVDMHYLKKKRNKCKHESEDRDGNMEMECKKKKKDDCDC
ncbi:hypothetical protein P5V15_009605 [Pogonomyrmex californicus]